MGGFFRRLRARIKYWNNADELKKELDAHQDMAAAAFADGGTPDRESGWKAARLLGNTTLAREDARAVWVARWIEQLWQDARYAVRCLWHTPAFTLTALATLVIAVGLNASVFSAFDALVLRPWDVPDAARVAGVYAARADNGATFGGWPIAEIRYLRQNAKTIDLVGMRDEHVQFDYQAVGESLPVRLATDNYFATLGIGVARGRAFETADDQLDAARQVVVLSDRVWRDGYGAREDIVGATILINARPFTVIGIARGGAMDKPLDPPPAAWLPLSAYQAISGDDTRARLVLTNTGYCCSDLAGRLATGASLASAQSEITGLSRQFRTEASTKFLGVRVTGTALLDTPSAGMAIPIFTLMFTGMLLLLLLACANVGNLFLARGLARQMEFRIRLSLGAGRARIVRQLVTEGFVLALVAGALSLPLAGWLPRWIVTTIDPGRETTFAPRVDVTVLVFTAATILAACMMFSWIPAVRSTRAAARLATGSRDGADRDGARLRLILLGGQIAISCVLIVGASLLARAAAHAARIDTGFALNELNIVTIALPPNAYTPARRDELARAVLGGIESSSGRKSVAITEQEPLTGSSGLHSTVRLPSDAPRVQRDAAWQHVSPGFFEVMGIPFDEGAPFTDADPATSVVVNETLARAFWPQGSAVGRTMIGNRDAILTVIGVTRDARLSGLEAKDPIIFQAISKSMMAGKTVQSLRMITRSDAAIDANVRQALSEADKRLRVSVKPLSANVRAIVRPSEIGAMLAACVGIIAVGVAAVGVFGVFSYLVAARRREVGVRLALGASRAHIVRVVLGAAGWALAGGSLAGVLTSAVFAPALRQYLYGLNPLDLVAFGRALGLLSALAILGTAGPVLRALRVNPSVTLREE
jgi:predicted permease